MTEIIEGFDTTKRRMEGVVSANLTTNSIGQEMTARELAQQIKFRACLHHAVLNRARSRIKDQLRAAGLKISHYSAREISELAEEYVHHHREELMESVRPWVERMIFKPKR